MKFDTFSLTDDQNMVLETLKALPSVSKDRKQLFKFLIDLSEGTTTVDKDRNIRQGLAVAGFGILEDYYKAIPQAAIDDRTLFAVPAVHYNFEEYFGGDHTETGVFFKIDRSGGGYNIELTQKGCIALSVLEDEYQAELGTVPEIIQRNYVDRLNADMERAGYTPITWPITPEASKELKHEPSDRSVDDSGAVG